MNKDKIFGVILIVSGILVAIFGLNGYINYDFNSTFLIITSALIIVVSFISLIAIGLKLLID